MEREHFAPITNLEVQEPRSHSRSSGLTLIKQELPKFLKAALPILVVGLCGYAVYVYCYTYCWREVIQYQNKRIGIAFIAVFCTLAALLGLTWTLIFIVGPGRYHVDPEEEKITEKEVFLCDPQGYVPWCSSCQAPKPDRVHHSAELGYCVPKMDHFCGWIGSMIGLNNYKLFILFLFYFMLMILFLLISSSVYAEEYFSRSENPNAHMVVIFILSAFWSAILLSFTGVHIRYILINTTTIEQMKLGRNDFPIYNFKNSDGTRIVSRMRFKDPTPYDIGPYNNWKDVMGNSPWLWFLPIPNSRKDSFARFNPRLLQLFRDRYQRQQEGYPAQVDATQLHFSMDQDSP